MLLITNQKKKQLTDLVHRIKEEIYTPVADLSVTAYVTSEPVSFKDRRSGRKIELKPGQKWGELFDCAWFHFTGNVPAAAAGLDTVLLIDINGEACVMDSQGNPVLGLTSIPSGWDSDIHTSKAVVPVAKRGKPGQRIDLWADGGCNDLFGVLKNNGVLAQACIAVRNPQMHGLYYDLEVLHDLMREVPENSARYHQIFMALSDAYASMYQYTEPEAAIARGKLARELARKNGDSCLAISAIGHAHIDLAWLWPIRETLRKGARTFSTVLRLMDQYPDYVFGASQPQLYQWMKDRHPKLYRGIKKQVTRGRWEVQGGMWVEADANVTGGESLVRQILYGKRFFQQEFGREVRSLWLPDVFGYNAALPQILKKSGIDYFMTQKLSWSMINKFPHHTFWWQGVDGSRVLAHMPPENTYNSMANPAAIAWIEQNYAEKAVSDRALMLFGIGDGGGGPGEEHLERLSRQKNLLGLAPVVQETSEAFFKRLDRSARQYDTWNGELYLEVHQGTYTTQARNKRFNRKMELALRDLELAATQAMLVARAPYPQGKLDDIWKETLLYQFHDILPGSSIGRVYDESLARYAVLFEEVAKLTAAANRAFTRTIDTRACRKPVVVSNSLSWARSQWLHIGGKWRNVHVPAMGHVVVDASAPGDAIGKALRASKGLLENDFLKVTFNADGSIAQVHDKVQDHDALRCAGNRLAVYLDDGDAWDFQMDYARRPPQYFTLRSSQARVDGPRAVLVQTYAYGKSTLVQEIILTEGSRRVDFVTKVSWRERRRMLRTSFPVQVQADEAVCDIQYGTIRRPTHTNTTWEAAKHEICAHKWVDISQRDYGVALLNDCKYGYRVHDNILNLNLLRSPTYPDKMADHADHEFTYSLFPHAGDHIAGGVSRAGYELNVPLRMIEATRHNGTTPANWSLLQVDSPNIVIETVKKAEDDGCVIIRAYEISGQAVKATFHVGMNVSSAEIVDLLECSGGPLRVRGRQFGVKFGPFEIQTIKLIAAD